MSILLPARSDLLTSLLGFSFGRSLALFGITEVFLSYAWHVNHLPTGLPNRSPSYLLLRQSLLPIRQGNAVEEVP